MVFQYSRGMDSRALLYKNIWIIYGCVGGCVVALGVVLAFLIKYKYKNDIRYFEAGFLATLSFTLSGVAMAYSFATYRYTLYSVSLGVVI